MPKINPLSSLLNKVIRTILGGTYPLARHYA